MSRKARTDRDSDRDAIMRVITAETTAYFKKDYEGWACCWVDAPYARRLGWYARGGAIVHVGFGEESTAMKADMQRYPTPNPSLGEVRRENVTIRADKDIAWVTFEQIAPRTGDPFDVPGRQHEVRILEKHDGAWKIACAFVLGSAIEFAGHPLMRVDADSKVLWMNEFARHEAESHRALTIRDGRLRARERAGDQRLQEAIKWASGIRGYAGFQAMKGASPVPQGALPVVLGEEDGAIDLCWVTADSGMVLVSFNDVRATEVRLQAAALVYALSPAQFRLAALIVGGSDLVGAARQLGVSAATARTQLKRIFEKTGVRSQPALVRVLLSVTAPLA